MKRILAVRKLVLVALAVLLVGSAGMNQVRVDRPNAWAARGYVELVPSLRLPTSRDESDRITIWIKLPPGGRIAAQGASLRYPAGTVVERVEWIGASVVDVRGTRFAAGGGERFHVLRPVGAALEGLEWARGDEAAQARATDGLAALLERAGMPEPRRAQVLALNRCASCHGHDKPEATRADDPGPHRSTDGGGLYMVRAALEDRAPLAGHRARELNVDRFVSARCGDVPAELVGDETGALHWRCADGTVPIGRYDLAAALAAGDQHARAVCESRRWLRAHLDGAGVRQFAAGFAACGLR